jgi:hypothetical protein
MNERRLVCACGSDQLDLVVIEEPSTRKLGRYAVGRRMTRIEITCRVCADRSSVLPSVGGVKVVDWHGSRPMQIGTRRTPQT